MNSNMRHHSAFGTHFEPQRTREDPLNPQLPAHCSTTLGSARHSQTTPHHHQRPDFKSRPLRLCSAFSFVKCFLSSSALDGEARKWACIQSLGTLSFTVDCSRTASRTHEDLTVICLRPPQPRPVFSKYPACQHTTLPHPNSVQCVVEHGLHAAMR